MVPKSVISPQISNIVVKGHKMAHILFIQFSSQINFQFGSWYCFLRSMGKVIMQSQPYPVCVTFNVFCQMTIYPKVSARESQSKSLGPPEIDWSTY